MVGLSKHSQNTYIHTYKYLGYLQITLQVRRPQFPAKICSEGKWYKLYFRTFIPLQIFINSFIINVSWFLDSPFFRGHYVLAYFESRNKIIPFLVQYLHKHCNAWFIESFNPNRYLMTSMYGISNIPISKQHSIILFHIYWNHVRVCTTNVSSCNYRNNCLTTNNAQSSFIIKTFQKESLVLKHKQKHEIVDTRA